LGSAKSRSRPEMRGNMSRVRDNAGFNIVRFWHLPA
jgi:hypothetical protein